MFLESLTLQNFRSYRQKSFDFRNQTTLIVGPNASGKTNILEAICLLAWGKSFRAQLEREMISYGKELARVEGKIKQLNNETIKQLEIILTTGQVQGKKAAGKIFKVNGVNRRWRDFAGNLKVVIFRPEDSEIVLGSPSVRRDYLDSVLEQVDPLYRQCHLVYQKGLRQRNRLLDKIREGEANRTQLEYWNRLLIKNGEIISGKREEMIQFFNDSMTQLNNLIIEYDKSAISPERLTKYAEAEVAMGATLVGPHRDDIKLKVKSSFDSAQGRQKSKIERELSLFGSRGEQRMAVLALKMAELEFINQKAGEQPVLLLDDIFSELDEEHRQEVLSLIDQQQTIITTTETDLVPKKFLDRMEKITL